MIGMRLVSTVFALCYVSASWAHDIPIDATPFSCAEEESACEAQVAEMQRLHRQQHIIEAQGAVAAAELAAQTARFNAAKAVSDAALALTQARSAELDAKQIEENKRRVARRDKLPGLTFSSAEIRSTDEEPQTCDALPFLRHVCALPAVITAETPNRFSCKVDLKGTVSAEDICYLPPSSRPIFDLVVVFSCDAKEQAAQTTSLNAKAAYFSCDLR
ncbi:hypothetical protein ACS3SW_20620 [Roseobacteraceae bacterium S113]